MRRIFGITWDYDGTIGMTFERQFNWFKHWSKINNKPFHFEEAREFQHFYNHHINQGNFVNVYSALDLPCDYDAKPSKVWTHYEEFKEKNPVAFYPEMRDTLFQIYALTRLDSNIVNNRAIRMSINTTNRWTSIYNDLKDHGVIQCFDSFVAKETLDLFHGNGDANSITKPSKISLYLTLENLNLEGDQVIHIGDSLSDLKASLDIRRPGTFKSESLKTIGVSWGYEGRKFLEKGVETPQGTVHFDYIVDKPEQLVEIVRTHI